MMDEYKVLIIENQKKQFNEIRKKLCQDFFVLPEENDFVKIADFARISLTQRYDNATHHPGERRKRAINELVEYINKNLIDLLIIDHVLVGHQPSENGIHLAKKLRDQNIEQPIIFLSRTERNKKSVIHDLQKLKMIGITWIEKGYAGQGIGDPFYFKINVVDRISASIGSAFDSMLDNLARLNLAENHLNQINELRGKKFTHSQKNKLKLFCSENPATKSENDLLNLLNQLKNA